MVRMIVSTVVRVMVMMMMTDDNGLIAGMLKYLFKRPIHNSRIS